MQPRKHEDTKKKRSSSCFFCAFVSSWSRRPSVGECSEEGRALVRVAPLGAERRAGEHVLRRHTNRRIVDRRERMEPLHRAAGWIVGDVLVHIEGHLTGGHLNLAAVIGELNRRR